MIKKSIIKSNATSQVCHVPELPKGEELRALVWLFNNANVEAVKGSWWFEFEKMARRG